MKRRNFRFHEIPLFPPFTKGDDQFSKGETIGPYFAGSCPPLKKGVATGRGIFQLEIFIILVNCVILIIKANRRRMASPDSIYIYLCIM